MAAHRWCRLYAVLFGREGSVKQTPESALSSSLSLSLYLSLARPVALWVDFAHSEFLDDASDTLNGGALKCEHGLIALYRPPQNQLRVRSSGGRRGCERRGRSDWSGPSRRLCSRSRRIALSRVSGRTSRHPDLAFVLAISLKSAARIRQHNSRKASCQAQSSRYEPGTSHLPPMILTRGFAAVMR